MNWYIVQAYSGFEKKVVESIKDTLVKNKLDSHLSEILVPTHQVTEVKKGKRTKKSKVGGHTKEITQLVEKKYFFFQELIQKTIIHAESCKFFDILILTSSINEATSYNGFPIIAS